MAAHTTPGDEAVRPSEQSDALLSGVSPRQMAGAIRSLDSRLVGMGVDSSAAARTLIYTFIVAGRMQTFRLVIDARECESITDLYPEAMVWEQQLRQQFDLTFVPAAGRSAE